MAGDFWMKVCKKFAGIFGFWFFCCKCFASGNAKLSGWDYTDYFDYTD
jgi:hypothetical protein